MSYPRGVRLKPFARFFGLMIVVFSVSVLSVRAQRVSQFRPGPMPSPATPAQLVEIGNLLRTSAGIDLRARMPELSQFLAFSPDVLNDRQIAGYLAEDLSSRDLSLSEIEAAVKTARPRVERDVAALTNAVIADVQEGRYSVASLRQAEGALAKFGFYGGEAVARDLRKVSDLARAAEGDQTMAKAQRMAEALRAGLAAAADPVSGQASGKSADGRLLPSDRNGLSSTPKWMKPWQSSIEIESERLEDPRIAILRMTASLRSSLVPFMGKKISPEEVHRAVEKAVIVLPMAPDSIEQLNLQLAATEKETYRYIQPLAGLSPEERSDTYIAMFNLILHQLEYAAKAEEIRYNSSLRRQIAKVLSPENVGHAGTHVGVDSDKDKAGLLQPTLGKPLAKKVLQARYWEETSLEKIQGLPWKTMGKIAAFAGSIFAAISVTVAASSMVFGAPTMSGLWSLGILMSTLGGAGVGLALLVAVLLDRSPGGDALKIAGFFELVALPLVLGVLSLFGGGALLFAYFLLSLLA